jgi:hypothetical protein
MAVSSANRCKCGNQIGDSQRNHGWPRSMDIKLRTRDSCDHVIDGCQAGIAIAAVLTTLIRVVRWRSRLVPGWCPLRSSSTTGPHIRPLAAVEALERGPLATP